uniref:SURF1-like protein n=1 Tax=Daphnia galeata TaxID=27404 RepID=A0A8J2RIH9_9CRUS|nr:unnamed protein product [Daphnia galeata]
MLSLRHFQKIRRIKTSTQSYVRRSASSYGQRNAVDIGIHGYSLLAIPAITFGLGTWQIFRREWKLGVIEHLASRTSAPPIPFQSSDIEGLSDMEYRKFVLHGTFEHDKEVYIGPRSLVGNEKNETGGMLSSGQSGYLVITPFKLSNSNLTVLVNRGWIPRKKMNPFTRLNGQKEGETALIGVYRSNENRPQFVPQNQPKDRMFHFRDVEGMARLLDVAPIFFDADADSSVPDGPVGGQTVVTVRNEHVSYILTWYTLSIITAFLWHRRFIKKMPLM